MLSNILTVCVCGSDDGGDDSVVATGVLELDTSDAVAIPERERSAIDPVAD
jgi:hypothetical protein